MFSDRLKKARKTEGMTQVALAEVLGVSKGTIAMWEIGKREPSFHTLMRLADIFGCSADWLLQDYRNNTNEENTEVINNGK